MPTDDLDELEHRNGSRPPSLPPDASLEDAIGVLNDLLKATRTHSVELEGIRLALQEHGTRIETFCLRIERALGVARNRDTNPSPPPEGT